MTEDEQRIQDLCNKSEIYKKIYAELLTMPNWRKEVYNNDFATSTHSIKIPIEDYD